MQEISGADLDMAYKYPFSDEAKRYISVLKAPFEPAMLESGRRRLDDALQRSRIPYSETGIAAVKQVSVISYLYARMLVSAMASRLAIGRYVKAEAERCGEALKKDTEKNVLRIATELRTGIEYDDGFYMPLTSFLMLSPKTPAFALVRQELEKGIVYMDGYRAAGIMKVAIEREMSKGLPIPSKDLPREVVAYARGIRAPMQKASLKTDQSRYEWIAKLLGSPIPDVRHRTVNLILAPYLVNVKGMSEEEAAKTIIDYIERCKQIEPSTKVNETYIRYQCRYAKAKGSKPLTHENAKELLKGVIEL